MLCDTNIISELARPKPNPGVLFWARENSHIHLSVVTLEELHFGLSCNPNPRINLWLKGFLIDYCSVLPISEQIANFAGEMRGNFQAKGETRTQADMLIAATACIHDLRLVTRNTRDFAGCGIKIVDPFK